jgi:DNA primase catalytic core
MALTNDLIAELNRLATAFYQAQLAKSPVALALLRARGLTDETIAYWKLGYAPASGMALMSHLNKHDWGEGAILEAGLAGARPGHGSYDFFYDRLMFPILDRDGERVLGFSSRRMKDDNEDIHKYVNSGANPLFEKSKLFYGMPNLEAVREKDGIFIVEGNFDMISLWQAGVTNVAALCGTALTPEHLALISLLTNHLNLVLDADPGGVKATRRSVVLPGAHTLDMGVIQLTDGKDPDEIVRETPTAWAELVKGRISRWEYLWQTTLSPYREELNSSVEARIAWKDDWARLVLAQSAEEPEMSARLLERAEKHLRLTAGSLGYEYLGLALPPSPPPPSEGGRGEGQHAAERQPGDKKAPPTVSLLPHDDLMLIALFNHWEDRRVVAPYLNLERAAQTIKDYWLSSGQPALPARLLRHDEVLDDEAENAWGVYIKKVAAGLGEQIRELSAKRLVGADTQQHAESYQEIIKLRQIVQGLH